VAEEGGRVKIRGVGGGDSRGDVAKGKKEKQDTDQRKRKARQKTNHNERKKGNIPSRWKGGKVVYLADEKEGEAGYLAKGKEGKYGYPAERKEEKQRGEGKERQGLPSRRKGKRGRMY
jgi:hypothetical protein